MNTKPRNQAREYPWLDIISKSLQTGSPHSFNMPTLKLSWQWAFYYDRDWITFPISSAENVIADKRL